jgi:rRNA small subunit pseudouridine methyltransferase Nep1
MRCVACTSEGPVSSLSTFVTTKVKLDEPIVFVVGAMAKGDDTIDYAEEYISFSSYPLSASVACSKIMNSFEEAWGVL